MRIDHVKERLDAPRLAVMAASLLALIVLALVAFSGPAAAAVGNTDLSITKTDTPDPIVQGNNLTYTITVTNGGANDASNVVVTDNLSANPDVDFVSATSTQGSCQRAGNTVTCDLGTVLSGTSQTVTIIVKPKKDGTITNTATVASPNDTNPANNSATATTTVTKPGNGNAVNNPNKKGRASCAVPTIVGTAGDDVISGTPGPDVIVTFTGNDQVFAGGGSDLICTDGGADFVFGDTGADFVIGGGGPDRLVGAGGGDTLKGKGGRDRLRGGRGNDLLNGGKKRDSCKGGAGRDALVRCP
jgi:uncharacterized repeat protein (TIGR01451 family)